MAVKGITLINGIAFTHADIIVNILGVPVVGVTEITYSDPQTMEHNYGTGNVPISMSMGQIAPAGTITLEMNDIEKLTNVAPGRKIQNIPFFDIGVNFVTEDGKLARHRLKKCKFKGRNFTSATGNQQITETIDLYIGEVQF